MMFIDVGNPCKTVETGLGPGAFGVLTAGTRVSLRVADAPWLRNMLIGVLCEVVNVVAQVEEERAFHDQAHQFIQEFVSGLDLL